MSAIGHSRLEITGFHRTLVTVSLIVNGIIALGTLAFWPLALVIVLPLGTLPAVLFALETHPRAFRLSAALFGTLYAVITVSLLIIGAVVLAPSVLALLGAAVIPAFADDDRARRRRCLLYLGAALTTFVVLVALLTV